MKTAGKYLYSIYVDIQGVGHKVKSCLSVMAKFVRVHPVECVQTELFNWQRRQTLEFGLFNNHRHKKFKTKFISSGRRTIVILFQCVKNDKQRSHNSIHVNYVDKPFNKTPFEAHSVLLFVTYFL